MSGRTMSPQVPARHGPAPVGSRPGPGSAVSSAGRQLAERALQGASGEALDTGLQQRLGAQLGEDFSRVRLHRGPAVRTAAAALGARAFTLGEHVALGGASAPAVPGATAAPAHHGLLAHELVHVAQQRIGGALAADAPAAEREAGAAEARVASAIARPVPVDGRAHAGARLGTAPGLACSREEWLQGSPGLGQRGFSELVEDIDDIRDWLGRQTTSSPESIRLEEALGLLQAEVARRQKGAARSRPKAADKGKGKGATAKAAPAVDSAAAVAEPPRILVERSSVHYEDEESMRAEVDRIVAWLQRDDVGAADRQLLQLELSHLSPQFEQRRARQAGERRSQAVAAALAPSAAIDDAKAQVVDAMQRIDAIVPLADRPGLYALMRGSEMIVMEAAEVTKLRRGAAQALAAAAQRAGALNQATFDRLNDHMRLNYEEQPYVGFAVSVVSGEEPVELFDRVQPLVATSNVTVSGFRKAASQGASLAQQAALVFDAVEGAEHARLELEQGVDRAMGAAGDIVNGLTITRDLSFAISLSLAAIVAAPVVAAGVGVGGLGFTGAGAVLATGAGTGGVVAGGGFVLRGGSAVAGELAAGHSGDAALQAGWAEGKRGGKEGLVAGVGGGVGFSTARALGLGTQQLTRAQTLVRGTVAGGAGGGSGNFAQGVVEGKSARETLGMTFKGTLTGGAGGLIGSASSTIGNAPLRNMAGLGGDVAFNAGLTYAETGDTTQALKSGVVSLATTGGVMAAANHPAGSTRAETVARDMGASVRRNVRSGAMALMLGTARVVPAVRGSLSQPGLVSGRLGLAAQRPGGGGGGAGSEVAPPVQQDLAPPIQQGQQEAAPSLQQQAAPPVQQDVAPSTQQQGISAAEQQAAPVQGRIAGEEVWTELAAEVGPGSSAQSQQAGVRGAVADAQSAGLVGAQGAPGTVDVAVQPHRNASEVRGEYGVTGAQQQSAHVNATSILRDTPGYSREAAPTMLMDPATHRAFDSFWKTWAHAQPAGRRTCTVAEMRGVMHAAINQIPNLNARQRSTLAWQLELELQSLNLRDTDSVRIPYSD